MDLGEPGDHTIRSPSLPVGAENPQGDGEEERQADGNEHELEGDRQPVGDLIGYRPAGDHGSTEVSLHRIAEPSPVPDHQRVVQTEFFTDLFDELPVLLGVDRDQCVDGVARQDVEEHEADEGDAEERQDQSH